MVLGGRRKSDPPSLLLFGCEITDDVICAKGYLVKRTLRKGSKPRVQGERMRAEISVGMKPGYIIWEPLTLTRCP